MAVMYAIGPSAESFDKSHPRQQETFSCPGAILLTTTLLLSNYLFALFPMSLYYYKSEIVSNYA